MSINLAEIIGSPDHYLHRFDGDHAIFVAMDRQAYHRSIFLDQRISLAGDGEWAVACGDLHTALSSAVSPSSSWIFHVAHCGSTLLARALDRLTGNLVLREPFALRQAVFAHDPLFLSTALRAAARRYHADLPTVIKANVPVNFVLPAIADAMPNGRAILLYSDLPDWLSAVLRSPNHRQWVVAVTEQLRPWLGPVAGADDVERAAILWQAQMQAFADIQSRWPGALALNSEAFFNSPANCLMRAAQHLNVVLDRPEIDRMVGGTLFAADAKRPNQQFDNSMRQQRKAALAEQLAPDIARAFAWVGTHGGASQLKPL